MKCNAFALKQKNGAFARRMKDIGDEIVISDGEATALRNGEIVATLQDAVVDEILDNGFTIEGLEAVSACRFIRQTWWCCFDAGRYDVRYGRKQSP